MLRIQKLGLGALFVSFVALNAEAVTCASSMVNARGITVKTFYGNGFDDKDACLEARKACRLELNRTQVPGYDCVLDGLVSGPVNPPTNPPRNPNPPTNPPRNPNPPTNPPYPGQGGGYTYQLNEIEQLLSSSSWRTRELAAKDLVRYPVARALKLALKAVKDSDPDVRNAGSTSLNSLLRTVDFRREAYEAFSIAQNSVRDSSWNVRLNSVKILREVFTLGAAELVRAAGDSDPDVRNLAASSLTEMRGQARFLSSQVLDDVNNLYFSGSWNVRLHAVHILGSSANPRYRSTIIRAMSDSDYDVRNAASFYY